MIPSTSIADATIDLRFGKHGGLDDLKIPDVGRIKFEVSRGWSDRKR